MNRAILLFSAAVLLWLAMAAPLAAFTVNLDNDGSPDGTVTDPATGLMWDRCAWKQTGTDCSDGSAENFTWQAALKIAVTANTEKHRGYNDWRLPNRTELESLVDINKETGPTIDTVAFPITPSGFFWSSTVYTPVPASAWVVNFVNGNSLAYGLQSSDLHVRLVRSGQSFDALAGVSTQIGIITQPSLAAQSGVEFPQQPQVEVWDTNGDAVPAAGINVTAAIASGGGTLDGTTTIATDADGRATFTNLAISGSVGDRTLSFSAGSLTPATSGTITLSAGPAAQIAINDPDNTNNQSAIAGSAVATLPSVIVRDASDNPVAGASVTFAVDSGGGSVTGESATTNASGIATVGSWTLGTAVGENTLTATADGLTGSPLLFTATAQNAPPTAPVITAPTPGANLLIEGLPSDVFEPMWAPSTDINGDPVTYRWELAADAQFSTLLLSVPTGSETQVTLTFEAIEQLLLANGIDVVFHRAIASDGFVEVEGLGAEVTLTLGLVGGPPSPPLNVQIQPTTQALTVSWVAPSDNGGKPIISYRAEANPSCEVTALADEVPGETAYSCTIGGLDPERDYTVTVSAINAAGESTAVAAAAARPLPVIPVPTLGTWALFGLMLLMLVVAMPALLKPRSGA